MNDEDFDRLIRKEAGKLRWSPGEEELARLRAGVRDAVEEDVSVVYILSRWLVPAAALLVLWIGAGSLVLLSLEPTTTPWTQEVAFLIEEDYYRVAQ